MNGFFDHNLIHFLSSFLQRLRDAFLLHLRQGFLPCSLHHVQARPFDRCLLIRQTLGHLLGHSFLFSHLLLHPLRRLFGHLFSQVAYLLLEQFALTRVLHLFLFIPSALPVVLFPIMVTS